MMKKVTILTSILSVDAAGGEIQAWVPLAERYGEIDYKTKGGLRNDGLSSNYSCVITIKYDSALQVLGAGSRVQIDSSIAGAVMDRTYRVASVEFSGANQREFIVLNCEDVR